MKCPLVQRLTVFLALALIPSLVPAQDHPSKKPVRRVPIHFGQVGLSPSQREKIYEIRTRHHLRIETLEQEIARLKASELAECEAVLTESQRRLLAHTRASAQARALARKSARANPQKTTP